MFPSNDVVRVGTGTHTHTCTYDKGSQHNFQSEVHYCLHSTHFQPCPSNFLPANLPHPFSEHSENHKSLGLAMTLHLHGFSLTTDRTVLPKATCSTSGPPVNLGL